MNWLIGTFLVCQLFVVLFIALHDWVPLGKLSNRPAIRAADTRRRLLWVTALSTLPYAIGFAASAYYAATGFPMWLMYLLWISYIAGFYGLLRAWWVPYLLLEDRYGARVTKSDLPARTLSCRRETESGLIRSTYVFMQSISRRLSCSAF